MNEKIVQEILHELFSSLETLDTQSAAILEFLKDKGIGSEKDLAPYLERAGNASSVRWRAVRVRIEYLLNSATQAAEQDARKESPKSPQSREESNDRSTEAARSKETEKGAQGAQPVGSSNETETSEANSGSEKNRQPQANNSDGTGDADANKDQSNKAKEGLDRPGGKTEKKKTEKNAA
jgi:hypothetical protein